MKNGKRIYINNYLGDINYNLINDYTLKIISINNYINQV